MLLMLDIILFGATGLTGSYCIPYLHKLSKQKGRNLTWGIAGRSEEKLKNILEKMSRKLGVDLSATPIFLADINDYPSLKEMTRQTRLLLNCCGPLRHTGKYAVKACLETGTHHLDLSAELDFSEYLETYVHEQAKEKGIYVLTACAYDSMIYEMGLIYFRKKFQGLLNSVEIYLQSDLPISFSEPAINFTTWASVIDVLSDYDSYKETCKRAKPTNMPKLLPELKKKRLPHKPGKVKGWASPCLNNDKYVMAKTQEYVYKTQKKRPIQLGFYHIQDTLITVILFQIIYALASKILKFKFMRRLFLDYAPIFSFGFVGTNLKETSLEKSLLTLAFYGEGWKSETLENEGTKIVCEENELDICRPVNSCMTMTISAYNGTYKIAALCLVLSGIFVLTEKEKLGGNGKGGVYTPGVAFEKTAMIEEIMEEGVEINITQQRDI